MYLDILESINACVLIPTYNNQNTLERVINGVLSYTQNVLVVNDGSTDRTAEILTQYPQLIVAKIPQNKGKGNALRMGFKMAIEKGYDYVITIDSDGQHFPSDLPVFVEKISEKPDALLIGERNMDQDSVPRNSSFGNNFSNFWFWFETGIKLNDTQSGYRLYPLRKIKNLKFFTTKFEFEIEVIVKAAWEGITVENVPVKVLYDENERVSHFRPFRDFARISFLNTYLVILQFLYIIPRNYFRKFKTKGFKRFFFEDLLHEEDSNAKKAMSVALGVFCGIMPFWGFQTVLTLFLAYVFKLNKLISFAFSHISIPPMIPIIVYVCIKIGDFTTNETTEIPSFSSKNDYKEFFQNNLTNYLIGSIILAIFAALLFGLITYVLLNFRNRNKSISQA